MLPEGMDSELEAAVDARSTDMNAEFEEHFQQVIAVAPSAEDRRDQVFQAWVIQKIAGLQLSVEAIASKFNAHLGSEDHLN